MVLNNPVYTAQLVLWKRLCNVGEFYFLLKLFTIIIYWEKGTINGYISLKFYIFLFLCLPP